MNKPVYLWCEQKDCKKHVLLIFRPYKPIVHDAVKAGWEYKSDKWFCNWCAAK